MISKVSLYLAMSMLLMGCTPRCSTTNPTNDATKPKSTIPKKLPSPLPKNQPEFERLVWEYLRMLPQQTGNTDGYPQMMRYNIHRHEPARSIISIGPRCIPLLKNLLNDNTLTKATWPGRSGSYTLRVSDVVVCILREIGGPVELAVLKRHHGIQHKIWLNAKVYKDKMHNWTSNEKSSYMYRFEDCHRGKTITIWAIQVMEVRLGKQKGKP